MSTLERILAGVHSRGACGTNTAGYAAIGAANMDPHIMTNYPMVAPVSRGVSTPKVRYSSHESLLYLLGRLVESSLRFNVFVLLLSYPMSMCSSLHTFMDSFGSRPPLFIKIHEDVMRYSIEMFHGTLHSSGSLEMNEKNSELLASMCRDDLNAVVFFPDVSMRLYDLCKSIRPRVWCAPATRRCLWRPLDSGSKFCDMVLPWSYSGNLKCYTIGAGYMRTSTQDEIIQFLGRTNFYNSMISNAPVDGSCVDCRATRRIGMMLVPAYDKRKERSWIPGVKSLRVLEETDMLLQEAMK